MYKTNSLSYSHIINLIGILTVSITSLFFYFYRYGGITGSTLYEAAHCRTKNGSLLNKIMGGHSKFTPMQWIEEKKLEKKVLRVASKKEKVSSVVFVSS